MSYGAVTVGRLTLRETYVLEDVVNALTGQREVRISGQESMPPLTMAQILQRREDLTALFDDYVSITFRDKAEYNGFYHVVDIGATSTNVTDEIITLDWTLSLELIGPDNAVDIESRFSNVLRPDTHGLAGPTRAYAPAIGAYALTAGAAQSLATAVARVGSAGTVTTYIISPSGAAYARWGIAAAAYLAGSVKYLQDGVERTGVNLVTSASGWGLDNGLLSVSAGAAGTVVVSSFSGSAYHSKTYNVSVAGSAAGNQVSAWSAVALLRNEPEVVTIRIIDNRAPGRAMLDLTLRRGARFVEGYLQTDSAATLGWWLNTLEASNDATPTSGYVYATANDADGNKFTVGSGVSGVVKHASGGISKPSTSTLSFYAGAVIGGSAAVSGDAPVDLYHQYIGSTPETVTMVRR